MNRWLDVFRLRVRSLFRRSAADRELDRELRFHLDEHVAELVAAGQSEGEARRSAMREFGSLASVSEQCRDTRRVNFLNHLAQELPVCRSRAESSADPVRGRNNLDRARRRREPRHLRPRELAAAVNAGRRQARTPRAHSHRQRQPRAYRAWRQLHESGVLAGIAGYQIEANVNWRGPEISVPMRRSS